MKKVINRFNILLKRRRNARKLGIKFHRASKWVMPKEILINNLKVKIDLINDNSTKTAFIDIFLDDCYGLLFLKSYLIQIRSILDVGANQGLFTLSARNIFPEAEIHSYEPNEIILSNLEHQSNIAKSKFFIEAVGLRTGRISLQFEKDSLHTKTVSNECGTIPQISIEECINRMGGEIDLLKLDCEGAEWEILEDTFSLKKIKVITMEYHLNNAHEHNSIIKVLSNADFKIVNYSIDGPTWGRVWAINKNFFN